MDAVRVYVEPKIALKSRISTVEAGRIDREFVRIKTGNGGGARKMVAASAPRGFE